MIADFVDKVCEAKNLLYDPFPIDSRNWKDSDCRRETTVTRNSDERRWRQRIGDDDCGG
jgi:hypothetical protein